MEENKKKDIGRIIGEYFVLVLAACLSAIVIAFTVKFIIWMF